MKRKIVRIDEEKCDGCGQCADACAEGAIRIVDGKARLVSETYCDGLGACIGECPCGAITVEDREAEAFDPEAVERHLAGRKAPAACPSAGGHEGAHACPGSLSRSLMAERPRTAPAPDGGGAVPSSLGNWPVQLRLAPLQAPYYQRARLLVCADCVPFALADFHRRFLRGRSVRG